MTNKLVRVQNANPSYLSFGFNKKVALIGSDWSYGGMSSSDMDAYAPDHLAAVLHAALSVINLVTEVTVRPYEISVQFADAFGDDEAERARILDEATAIIDRILFAGADEPTVISDKDDRGRYSHYDDDDLAA